MTSLALGTVQFGLTYGVANRTGQVPLSEVVSILQCARARGIDTLDTAIAYGESEARLGEAGVAGWQVVSKLPPVANDCADAAGWVHRSVDESLARLRLPRLKGVLLHRARDLLEARGVDIIRALEQCRHEGKIGQVGVSIYDPEELAELTKRCALQLVQAPFSIVDRRLETSGWLARLHAAGIEVHVRSIFLQGLLLMNDAQRPGRFAPWQALWAQWAAWLRQARLTPLQACLGFALSQLEIARVVVGVDGRAQLEQILASADVRGVAPPRTLTSSDPGLINPLSWITT